MLIATAVSHRKPGAVAEAYGESCMGPQTTFVTLPAYNADSIQIPRRQHRQVQFAGLLFFLVRGVSLTSLRILVVDDHEDVRDGLRSLLSARSDWVVCDEAADGVEAVEKAIFLRPDVVLMDVSMPRLSGLGATKIIRRDIPEAEVVIFSADDAEVMRLQALDVNAAAYLAKRDLPDILVATIDRLVRERRAQGTGDSSSPRVGDEMSALIQGKNWSETPIGPPENWSPSLRMMVDLLLANRFPLLLWWGPQYVSIYNDAYRPILGTKHPKSLGLPVSQCWNEIWHILQPLIDTPFNGGPATWMDDLELEIRRSSFTEETHFTVAYSPVPDETAPRGIGGVLATVHEITEKIVSARRVAILRDLGAHAMEAKTAEEACGIAADILAKNSKDVPFALLYLVDSDNRTARLAGVAGTAAGEPISPSIVDLTQSERLSSVGWPLAEALRTEQMVTVNDLRTRFAQVPHGYWSDPPRVGVVLPIRSNRAHEFAGLLVSGVSARLALDHLYRSFFELVATQIAAAVSSARAYEEERKQVAALAEIDRAKTAFFSNVSHEFRTPLTLMLGPVEDLLAKSYTELPLAAKTQLELVSRNGSRLLRLVNTLLDFSRIEAGRMQAVYEPTDLSGFTRELASVFRSATERAGVGLELDCPKLAEPIFVDRSMWEKIVLNLISNAFKFTFEGKIVVSLVQAGHAVELRVRDTGVGIPAKELPRLFERFHRIENTRSRTHEGSGIGLALVQELVKLHSGLVCVESTLGQGTTFVVSIPVGNAHLPPDRIAASPSRASTALSAAPFVDEALRWLPDTDPSDLRDELTSAVELLPVSCPPVFEQDGSSNGRAQVLIADDNADMRAYLVRLLAERYDVRAVANGLAALDAAQERRPDLILSDVMMPELDGFGLLRQLRSDASTSTIPIILLSARAGEESRMEGLEHGADDYLIKPFTARELLARVQTHLELARVRRDAADALRKRTAQFETLLNEAPLGVYLVDADFRIRQVNPTALPVFGDIPALVGRDFAEVIRILRPSAYADEVIERFRHTLETGEPYFVAEHVQQRRDRGVREVYEWRINRIVLPEGSHGVVCYFRDISAQVQTREILRDSEERLRALTGTLETEVRARTGELERRNLEVLQQSEQLRELSNRLVTTQDQERRHIARELHDSAGQELTALGLNLGRIGQLTKPDPTLNSLLKETRELVQQLSREIRTTSYLLHPPLLDDNGLSEAIRWYIQGLAERSGLKIDFLVSENFGRLAHEMELAIFRIVQECLTNIHRHSGSQNANIRLSHDTAKVTLEIEDHGKGMSAEKLAAIREQRSGVGITGMRERLRHLRGILNIESTSTGTKISVTVPLAAASRRETTRSAHHTAG